ncbi:MAG: ArsB/NhaD family transporter [Firmicutes bacterium]|nr:ArsB/NhaD family transporter [Bacillota bacterium]
MVFFWGSILIFVAVYVLIIIEKFHRSIVALLGAVLAVTLGVLNQSQAIQAVDFNTIGLLIGMMIIVGITRRSGVFEYLAVRAARLAGGRPLLIMAYLATVTAVLSAFLDNVTTVLLIVPVTFTITDRLGVNPIPFLIAQIFAANIGGTATLIGDPPNIMIGSATGLGFMDFVRNLTLPVILIHLITIGILVFLYRNQLDTTESNQRYLLELNELECIKDWALLKRSLAVLSLTILGFLLHQALHLESATIALLGAALLMLVNTEDPEDTLLTVDWPTIFFFVGLFIIVGGLKANGVIDSIARKSLAVTGSGLLGTGMLVLWLSAISSAIVDNIPFVAAMIPLLNTLGELTHLPLESLWWALSLGACLGGNGTLIGASANVIVAGVAERYGSPIRFVDYLKTAFPLMLVSIAVSSAYLYLFFWR